MEVTTKIGAFVAGILIVQCWRSLPGLPELLIALLIIIICWLGKHWRMMFFVIGMIWVSVIASVRIAEQLPVHLEGQDISVSGVISGLPQVDGRRIRFDFSVINNTDGNIELPERLRLSWYNTHEEIKPGQQWRFTVRLKRPRGFSNPGGFDYERWLFSQNIGATGYIRKNPAPQLLSESSGMFNYTNWRQRIGRYLDKQLGDSEFLGVIKALSIGDRQKISQTQWQMFRNTGTVHLVAISGLHIGLVSGLVFFLVWRLLARLEIKYLSPSSVAALCAITAATGYAALAGFAIPTQRALIMLMVAMICVLRQRHNWALNVLALALLVVVIIDPLAVLSAGFWLSFLAVFIIMFILTGRLHKSGYWLSMLKVHCLISIGLAPLLLFFFQQFSLIAPVANFVAVPIISLWVVPMLLLSLIISLVAPESAGLLLEGALTGLELMTWLLAQLTEIDNASLVLPAPSVWAVLMASIACLILFMPRGLPGRWLGMVLLMPALFMSTDRPAAGQIKMTLLDVGQGLAAVIQTSEHVLVYDTGSRFSARFDMGESVVLPFLRSQAVEQVDMLLISHSDNDHLGGAEALLRLSAVNDILTSVPVDIKPAQARLCQAGQTWTWDQVVFTVLSPSKQRHFSENDNSCVLRIETRAGAVLLTGDIEQAAEDRLVKTYGTKINAEIMIAPHHGSNTSSSLGFLRAVQPEMILIPAGYRNRFGFPDQRVLERYRTVGAEWLTVGELGAVSVEGIGDGWLFDSYRARQGRYWNQR